MNLGDLDECKLVIAEYPPEHVNAESLIDFIRDGNARIPMLFIGNEKDPRVIERLLKLPVCEFMSTPISVPTLIAKANIMVNKSLGIMPQGQDIYKFADITINNKNKSVTKNGKKLSLTPTEYSLLLFFVINRGRVLSKESILANVWDISSPTSTKVVQVYIGYLREKLGHHKENDIIVTVPGFGYKIQ